MEEVKDRVYIIFIERGGWRWVLRCFTNKVVAKAYFEQLADKEETVVWAPRGGCWFSAEWKDEWGDIERVQYRLEDYPLYDGTEMEEK